MRRLSFARAIAVPALLALLGVPAVQARAAVRGSASVGPHVAPSVAPNVAPNAAVARALHQRFPQTRVSKVDCKLVAGLCEVQAGANIFYVDRSARYLVIGRVYDMEKRLDLTAASQLALGPQVLMANSAQRGDTGEADAGLAVKSAPNAAPAVGRGVSDEKAPDMVSLGGLPANGTIVWGGSGEPVTVFSDFHCSYCRLLHQALKELGVSVQERPISILGTRAISEGVLCASDKSAALERAYAGEAVAAKSCDTSGLDANEGFAASHGFSGTPVIVRSDGAVLRGYRPREFLATWLKAARP